MPERPTLRLLERGRVGPGLWLADPEQPPFEPALVVVEEDTQLVLGADPGFRDPGEHPVRILTAALAAEPAALPGLIVRGGRWHLVVHDLEASPSTDGAGVRAALRLLLDRLAAHAGERETTVQLPLVGARTGALSPEAAWEALVDVLAARGGPGRLRLWVWATGAALTRAERAAHRPPSGL